MFLLSRHNLDQNRRRRLHVKIDAVLEKHNWDAKLWLWALKEIHLYVFLDVAWPSFDEQKTFTAQLLSQTPHKSDVDQLISKVKYLDLVIFISDSVSVFAIFRTHAYYADVTNFFLLLTYLFGEFLYGFASTSACY